MSQGSLLPPTGLDGSVLEQLQSGLLYRFELMIECGVMLGELELSLRRLKEQGLIVENDYRELRCLS